MNQPNPLPCYSLPELIIQLFAAFEPVFDQKNIRLKINLDATCPHLWETPLEAFNHLITQALTQMTTLVEKTTLQLNFHYTAPQLEMTLDVLHSPELTQSIRCPMTPSDPNVCIEQSDLVLQWQLKDIETSDLVAQVVQSLPQRFENIQEATAKGDLEALREYVHAIKGVAGNFKMTELYTPLVEMDNALKGDEPLYSDFLKAFDTLLSVYATIDDKYFT